MKKSFLSFLLLYVGVYKKIFSKEKSLIIRRSNERGKSKNDWLDSKHSFSFASYRDEKFQNFHNLQVINEDVVHPLMGFPTHGHKNMEIITYPIQGALKHKDSMNNEAYIHAGEVQRMSAGSGVRHSEYNASSVGPVHFLQIWIQPNKKNIDPSYEQIKLDESNWQENKLNLIARPIEDPLVSEDHKKSIGLNSNLYLYASRSQANTSCQLQTKIKGSFWIQVIEGEIEVMGHKLFKGDAIAFDHTKSFYIKHMKNAHYLVFDVA